MCIYSQNIANIILKIFVNIDDLTLSLYIYSCISLIVVYITTGTRWDF